MKTGKRILSLLLSLILVLGTVAVGGVSVSAGTSCSQEFSGLDSAQPLGITKYYKVNAVDADNGSVKTVYLKAVKLNSGLSVYESSDYESLKTVSVYSVNFEGSWTYDSGPNVEIWTISIRSYGYYSSIESLSPLFVMPNDARLNIGDDTAIYYGEIEQSSGEGWSIEETENGIMLNLDDLELETVDNDCVIANDLDLTITGSAKLTATGDYECAVCAIGCNLKLNGNFILRSDSGISLYVSGNLTVDGGSLNTISTDINAVKTVGKITVNTGSVYAESSSDNAIFSGDIMTVNGGSVYAKTESTENDYAINAYRLTLNNGETFALGDENAKEVFICSAGSTFFYGTYPQSKVTDETTLTALNDLAPENFDDWTSYGYYSGTGTIDDGQMTPGDFMRYYDAVLDGVKYRAVKFTAYHPYRTYYACSADHSCQDDNGYNTNTVYWFKFEPIEWRVLDPNEGLILCESAIDSQAYNNYIISNGTDGYEMTAFWGDSAQTYYANNYAESSIRQWLNDDFINTAFSASQQENILITALNNDAYPESYSQYNSAQTNDKVFLLSYAEATNPAYGFDAETSNADTARRIQGSDYARCQGLYVYSSSSSEYNGNSYWRLRSPGSTSYSSCYVGYGGHVYHYDSTYDTDYGVVPALKLQNLKSDPTGAPLTIDPGMALTIIPEQPVWGDDITITATLPENATGTVTFRFDEADTGVEVAVENGEAVLSVERLSPGSYTVEAEYLEEGDEGHATASGCFEVAKAPLTIKAKDATLTYNGEEQGYDYAIYNNPDEISEVIEIDGLKYEDAVTSVTLNGVGKVASHYDITPMRVSVNDGGEENYEITYETGTLFINKANPALTVSAEDVDYGQTAVVTATLPNDAGGCVDFLLDESDTYERVAVINGVAKCEYKNLQPCGHKVLAVYSESCNYNDKTDEVTFTVNSVDCALTINYVYADGTEAAETYTDSVEIFKDYSVTSPEIKGCTPDITTVEGTMGDEDMDGKTVTVTYTADEYTATFVDENGETVEKVKFTVEDESITEPAVPEKAGYAGEWEEYTLGASDITIKPVYANITSIQIEDYEESSETGYKEDKTFTVKADDLPEGAEIHWFVNGEDVGTGESYTVEDPTDDYNIYAEVIDKDGNTLDTTKTQSVKVKNGFFDRLKAFFAELIEKILGKAIADLLSSVC